MNPPGLVRAAARLALPPSLPRQRRRAPSSRERGGKGEPGRPGNAACLPPSVRGSPGDSRAPTWQGPPLGTRCPPPPSAAAASPEPRPAATTAAAVPGSWGSAAPPRRRAGCLREGGPGHYTAAAVVVVVAAAVVVVVVGASPRLGPVGAGRGRAVPPGPPPRGFDSGGRPLGRGRGRGEQRDPLPRGEP